MIGKGIIACVTGVLITALTAVAAAAEPSTQPAGAVPAKPGKNPQLVNLEPNKWFKLHEQKPTDEPQFQNLGQFATCYDSKRGQIIMVGGIVNKKGEVPSNSPFFFDVATATWSRAYPDDVYETYKVNEQGVFVAGEKGDRPWGLGGLEDNHIVVYDPERDELVLCTFAPECHEFNPQGLSKNPPFDQDMELVDLTPGRSSVFTFKGSQFRMDFQVANQPVWVMNLERKQWSMLPARHPSGHGQYLAPAVYDSARKEIVTWSEGGIRVIAGERNKVECLGGRTAMAVGTAAYDAKNRAVVFYGRYGGSDEVTVYDHSSGKELVKKMPTPDTRPPKAWGCSMAYDPGAGKTVLCVPSQHPWTVETWLYDLTADAWKRMPDADLNDVDRGISRDCGSLIYDENHHVCLFVIHQVKDRRRGPLTVWALKIDESKASSINNIYNSLICRGRMT